MASPDSLNFDRVADLYDDTRGGERRGRQFAADMAKLLRSDVPVLEVGIGTGVIAKALAEMGFDVFGVDISEAMLSRAKTRIGHRMVRGDAMQLPFATASIDQVVVVWVLHVVGDAMTALTEIARVLKDDGRCLVVDGKPWGDDPRDPIAAAYRDIEAAFSVTLRRGRAELHAALAPSAGLRVIDTVTAGPHEFEASVAEAANNIEKRAHSWMWTVPDDEWERIAPSVVERLRALPDFDRPVPREGFQDILVLAK